MIEKSGLNFGSESKTESYYRAYFVFSWSKNGCIYGMQTLILLDEMKYLLSLAEKQKFDCVKQITAYNWLK